MVEVFPKEHWESVHAGYRLPVCTEPKQMPDHHRLFRRYLEVRGGGVLEVGCAPGKWLAYFAKYFEMAVAGIEYAEEAAELTRTNLRMQGLTCDIRTADFFESDLPESQYDLVFSAGFIEHYPDTRAVVNRIVRLAKVSGGYVITTVPNFLGINGLITRRFAPQIYESHVPISRSQLRTLHQQAGLEILFCNYGGTPYITYPSDLCPGPQAAAWWRKLAKCVRYLFDGANKFTWRCLPCVPRSRFLSPMIICIGRRGTRQRASTV